MTSSMIPPVSDFVRLYGGYDSQALSMGSSLIGGISLDGISPNSLTVDERYQYTKLLRSIYQLLPEGSVAYQYYAHHEGMKVELKPRQNERSHVLSQRRAAFLNERRLTTGRLFHFFELPFEAALNKVSSPEFLGHLFSAPFNRNSREIVKTAFFDRSAVTIGRDALEHNSAQLDSELKRISALLGLVSPVNHIMSLQEKWAFFRFLYNLNPDYLSGGLKEPVPQERWDSIIPDGDIEPVDISGKSFIKMHGPEPTYARLASIIGFGEEAVTPGVWGVGANPPVLQKGNYVICNRYKKMTSLSSALFFRNKKNELERRSLNVSDMLKGSDNKSALEEKMLQSDSTKELYKELDEIQHLADAEGFFSSHVIVFDKDPKKVLNVCREFNSSITQSGLQCVWESAGMTEAYNDALPVVEGSYPRNHFFTSSQAGAASLLYKSSGGQPEWQTGNGKEEPFYIFETPDGNPFHYVPFVNGRCLVIGVGPIRSGKSFTKNTLASHFTKYGGFLRTIDIDPGSEPIADFFGEDGGIFRFDPEQTSGFNPFSVTWGRGHGTDDLAFKSHFIQQMRLMAATNETHSMREFTGDEQVELERSLGDILRLPKHLQSLNIYAQHCGKNVNQKLNRFLSEGIYGGLFSSEKDAIGQEQKRVGAFNLAGVKDNKDLLPITMNEIFFRITRLFEDENFRTRPKYLDIDEAHNLLKIKNAREYLVSRVRTWGKWLGGIGLWSQSPQEFNDIEDWPALRSAASTLFFMSDPTMDESLYKETFNLTDGECEAIKTLIPKQQALIIQREINVSQIVNIKVEPEQYVVNTSDPFEATLRKEIMAKHGTDTDSGIAEVVRQLRAKGKDI